MKKVPDACVICASVKRRRSGPGYASVSELCNRENRPRYLHKGLQHGCDSGEDEQCRRNNIFSRMVPKVVFRFPVSKREKPFQQHAAQGAGECEGGCQQTGGGMEAARLQCVAAKKNYVCAQTAKENEQAVGDKKRPCLMRQDAECLL